MNKNEKTDRLVHLAMRFWTNCEAPSDDDWETIFTFLSKGEVEKFEAWMKESNIDTEN